MQFIWITYNREAMESAIEEVKTGGSSICGATRKYGISSGTVLCMIISQRSILGGVMQTNNSDVYWEREFIFSLIALGEMGFGLTKELVDIIVGDYLKETKLLNPFLKVVG